jgi:outer membrane receptor protein involved in Fe transport
LYQQALGLGEIGIIANQRANSAAAFGQATAEVFSQTNLTLGARYTYERRNYVGFEQGSLPSGASIGLISDDFREHEVAHAPSWRVALDRKLGAELLGYVSYNRGFKSGGFNGFDPTNPPYQPEYLNAYELGLKSQWLDQRLRLNTAAFLYNYSNIQISRYNITADVYNGAKARVYGLDLDGEARITPALSVTGSLEWLHSKFLDFPLAQFSTPLPGGGNTLFLASAQGNQLPYAPKFTLSLGATYRKSFELGSIAVNVTNAYNSGYFAETDNFLRQGAYDYLNSSLTWTAVDGKLSVRLFANNLLDKAVASQIGTASFGYFQAYANPPRTYGFSLQYQVR